MRIESEKVVVEGVQEDVFNYLADLNNIYS